MLLLPLYYQEVRGASALTAGLMLVPQGVGTLLSRGLAGRLTDRVGGRLVAVAVLLSFWLPAAPRTPAPVPANEEQEATLPREDDPGRATSPEPARREG